MRQFGTTKFQNPEFDKKNGSFDSPSFLTDFSDMLFLRRYFDQNDLKSVDIYNHFVYAPILTIIWWSLQNITNRHFRLS